MWGNWTSCDKECGGGKRIRQRTVQVEAGWNGDKCLGPSVENMTCNTQECPGEATCNDRNVPNGTRTCSSNGFMYNLQYPN